MKKYICSEQVTNNTIWDNISEFFKAGNMTEGHEIVILLKLIDGIRDEIKTCENTMSKLSANTENTNGYNGTNADIQRKQILTIIHEYEKSLKSLHDIIIKKFETNSNEITLEKRFEKIPSFLTFIIAKEKKDKMAQEKANKKANEESKKCWKTFVHHYIENSPHLDLYDRFSADEDDDKSVAKTITKMKYEYKKIYADRARMQKCLFEHLRGFQGQKKKS